MARPIFARYLAPAALVAVVFVAVVMLKTAGGGDSSKVAEPARTDRARRASSEDRGPFHRVKPGESIGSIAERNGVPVEQIITLNPGVDPQALPVGELIRVRR